MVGRTLTEAFREDKISLVGRTITEARRKKMTGQGLTVREEIRGRKRIRILMNAWTCLKFITNF